MAAEDSPARTLFIVICILGSRSLVSATGCIGPRSRGELMHTLWDNLGYDKYTRPNEASVLAAYDISSAAEPEHVDVHVRFDSLFHVDVIRGSFEVLITVTRRWQDWRLRFNGTHGCMGDRMELPGQLPIWKPDLYYGNLVEEGNIVGEYTRVYADGSVKWYTKQRMTLSCMMDFAKMPYDTQRCVTRISTFAGKDRDVQLGLLGSGVGDLLSAKYKKQYSYLQGSTEWRFTKVHAEVFDHEAIGDDDTALDFVADIQRDSSYWEHYIMFPAILVVTTSYASFFVTRVATPARGGTALFGFLTLANMVTGVRNSLPRTRGEHSSLLMDGLMISMYWCSYTVLEFAFGSWLARAAARADKYRKSEIAISEDSVSAGTEEQENRKRDIIKSVGRCTYWLMRRDMTIRVSDRHLDMFSRIVFLPGYFIALFVTYLVRTS